MSSHKHRQPKPEPKFKTGDIVVCLDNGKTYRIFRFYKYDNNIPLYEYSSIDNPDEPYRGLLDERMIKLV